MNEASEDAIRLMGGLLAHMKQIVGDGASYAMLHYGAVEEGKRLAAGYGPGDFPKLLGRLDAVLLQRSEVLKDEGQVVTIRVHSSPLLALGHRPVQGVILGLLEGALAATRQARYKGAVVQPSGKDEIVCELRRETP